MRDTNEAEGARDARQVIIVSDQEHHDYHEMDAMGELKAVLFWIHQLIRIKRLVRWIWSENRRRRNHRDRVRDDKPRTR